MIYIHIYNLFIYLFIYLLKSLFTVGIQTVAKANKLKQENILNYTNNKLNIEFTYKLNIHNQYFPAF